MIIGRQRNLSGQTPFSDTKRSFLSLGGEYVPIPTVPSRFSPKGPNPPRIALLLRPDQLEETSTLQTNGISMWALQTRIIISVSPYVPRS